MDDNVMRTYATKSTEARHYVQYDQGMGYESMCVGFIRDADENNLQCFMPERTSKSFYDYMVLGAFSMTV